MDKSQANVSHPDAVTFVYLGDSLPSYGSASLRLALEFSGLNIRLICSRSIASQRSVRRISQHVKVFTVEDFYDPAAFRAAQSGIILPASFRQGFWHRTLERLFVLEQFMSEMGEESLFHAELDQILFDIPSLLNSIEKPSTGGLAYPLHTTELGVASVLYVNNTQSLQRLLEFASSGRRFRHEMELLGKFHDSHPADVTALSTLADVVNPVHEYPFPGTTHARMPNNEHIVDAAQLGLWVAGEDPRNVRWGQRPMSHYVGHIKSNLLTQSQLSRVRAAWSPTEARFTVALDNRSWVLHNLHLHSKIHKHLIATGNAPDALVRACNSPVPTVFPGQRRDQVRERIRGPVALIRTDPIQASRVAARRAARAICRSSGARPRSSPFISGDDFRAIADIVIEGPKIHFRRIGPLNGSIVFCESDRLEDFKELHRRDTAARPVLILGNGDRSLTRSDLEGLDMSRIPRLFAQNLQAEHPHAEVLPIGLENRWRFQNNPAFAFSRTPMRRVGVEGRLPRIMWTFSEANNFSVRARARLGLKDAQAADNLGPISPEAHRAALRRYAFVASPEGNGIDCHRTWEALYSGCIPIVLDSLVTRRYKDLGIPVWLIQDYRDLRRLSENDLRAQYLALEGLFKSRPLYFPYWEQRVRAAVSPSNPNL